MARIELAAEILQISLASHWYMHPQNKTARSNLILNGRFIKNLYIQNQLTSNAIAAASIPVAMIDFIVILFVFFDFIILIVNTNLNAKI